MNQATMFDVPIDGPSRARRLHLFCREHGIACHDSKFKGDPTRWVAIHLADCRAIFYVKNKQADVAEIFGDACRVVDECNMAGYGASKANAIRELCLLYGINFNP